ncbi:uncharacterized protein METZ01_LOCUS216684, partial [marine metagenome]
MSDTIKFFNSGGFCSFGYSQVEPVSACHRSGESFIPHRD